VSWVLEADLKNFFGSLSHEWMLRFVDLRVGDPRLINLLRRWLKAGILEDGEIHPNEQGTPQGGSISVLLSNSYLHHVLDLWFERVVKPRLRGELTWCGTSMTLCCVSRIDRKLFESRRPCVSDWRSST
jgi:RNA-directed DNA polymerase